MIPTIAAQNRIALETAAVQARDSGRPVECTVIAEDGKLMGLVIVHEDGKVKLLPKESVPIAGTLPTDQSEEKRED